MKKREPNYDVEWLEYHRVKVRARDEKEALLRAKAERGTYRGTTELWINGKKK